MKKLYLANGQECYLVEKIREDMYIVNLIYQSCEERIVDTTNIVVQKVYKKPPTAKISNRIIKLTEEKQILETKVMNLKSELATLHQHLEKIKTLAKEIKV